MSRILFFVFLACLVVFFLKRKKRQDSTQTPNNNSNNMMVQRSACGLHIPESEALFHHQKIYCSKSHFEENA